MQELIPPITLSRLAPLKLRWKVSLQALIRRAFDLEVVTLRQYKYLMQQISVRGWRKKEPEELNIPIEKPRALSQMAELLYGVPVDYRRLAAVVNLAPQLVKDTLEVYSMRVEFTADNPAASRKARLLTFGRRTT